MKTTSGAFTLIELLVVISIIGILVIVTVTGLMEFKERAQLTKCNQSLRGAGTEYFRDFHELDSVGLGSGTIVPPPISVTAAQEVPGCPWCNPPAKPKKRKGASDQDDDASLALNIVGRCPKAGPNPMYEVDPDNQPPVRSFGVAERVAQGRNWAWMLADSDFDTILERAELAVDRHDGKISVFEKDGSVVALTAEQLAFPDEQEEP